MTSEYKMQFPFTTKNQILDWEAHYIEDLTEKRQHEEQTVINIIEKVKARQTNKTPKGYLLTAELREMAQWKSHFLPSKIDKNPPGLIEEVTGEALSLDNDWEKIEKLIKIEGVAESVASVILHLYDPKKYPILDVHALNSIGIDNRKVYYDKPFWEKYVNFCRAKAKRYGVLMRTLDRALYKYSQSGAASAIKITADEILFLEFERRGYDLSRLQCERERCPVHYQSKEIEDYPKRRVAADLLGYRELYRPFLLLVALLLQRAQH